MTDSPWYWQDAQRCCLSIARIITLRSLLAFSVEFCECFSV